MAKKLGEATDAYVKGRLERREIKVTTSKGVRDAMRSMCESLGRDRSPRSVKILEIEQWASRLATHAGAGTVRNHVGYVKAFWKWAVLVEIASVDPSVTLRPPTKPRTVPRTCTDDEVRRTIAMARDVRERLVLILMVQEGCRALEVSRLQLGDVDRRARTIFLTGKGGHERKVPLTDETEVALDEYLEERGRVAGALIQSVHRSVWNDRRDGGIKPHTIVVQVSRAMKRAGVPETGHALRHKFAQDLDDAGADVQVIQEALGHASLVTTQIYLKRASVTQLRAKMGTKTYATEDPEVAA